MTTKKKLSVGLIINGIVLFIIGFICLYPFLNVLAYSMSGYNAVLSGKVTFYPIDFNVDAYRQILGKTQIWLAMRATTIVTVLGTALSLILTIFAAYALSIKDLPGRKTFTVFILFTMYFSGGMIPTFIVVKSLGMYDTLLSLFYLRRSMYLTLSLCVLSSEIFRRVCRRLQELTVLLI